MFFVHQNLTIDLGFWPEPFKITLFFLPGIHFHQRLMIQPYLDLGFTFTNIYLSRPRMHLHQHLSLNLKFPPAPCDTSYHTTHHSIITLNKIRNVFSKSFTCNTSHLISIILKCWTSNIRLQCIIIHRAFLSFYKRTFI